MGGISASGRLPYARQYRHKPSNAAASALISELLHCLQVGNLGPFPPHSMHNPVVSNSFAVIALSQYKHRGADPVHAPQIPPASNWSRVIISPQMLQLKPVIRSEAHTTQRLPSIERLHTYSLQFLQKLNSKWFESWSAQYPPQSGHSPTAVLLH